MSKASDTDVRLFLQLANPNVTTRERRATIDEASDSPDDDDDDDDGVNLEGDDEEDDVDSGDDDEGVDSGDDDEEEDDEEDDEEDVEEVERASSIGTAPSPALDPTRAPVTMSEEDLMIEKQSVLMDLDRLRAQGITITRNYTLDDDLTTMQWEVRRHMLMIDEMNSISFMKDAMRLAFSGIEALNAKANLLELDGWGASASQELTGHKYDSALSKLYKKYWRRGSGSSPELQLALGVVGSMGAYHFKKKLFTARPTPRRAQQPLDDSDDEEAPFSR